MPDSDAPSQAMPKQDQQIEIDRLLCLVLEQKKEEQQSFLCQQTSYREETVAAVKQLLQRIDQFDDNPKVQHALHAAFNLTADQTSQQTPEQIGEWQLIREIGRGGMATVFLAERNIDGAKLNAAIKLLLPLRNSASIHEAFARERHILAALNHPGIANLIDGGITAQGQPWLAMEYVDGIQIDTYCNQNKLDIRARLRLFLQVTEAVEIAHQQLIIHRDIKPANILVNQHGQPKLLDFGIAKLINSADQSRFSSNTLPQSHALTPQYASPEQIHGQAIGTYTDCFQLGLLLDELIASTSARTMTGQAIGDLVKHCTKPIQTIAKRFVSSTHKEIIAQQRATTSRNLLRILNGDLGLILDKSYRIDPKQRYRSIADFIDDINRYLSANTISARKQSKTYSLMRFVQRHSVGFFSSILFIAVLSGATIFSINRAEVAQTERQRATLEAEKQQQVKKYLLAMFSNANPARNPGATLSVEQLLIDAEQSLQAQNLDVATKAATAHALGRAFFSMGQQEHATTNLELALNLFETHGLEENEDLAAIHYDLGLLLQRRALYQQAETHYSKSLSIRQRLYSEPNELTAQSILGVAGVQFTADTSLEEIAEQYRSALEIIASIKTKQSTEYANALRSLASLYARNGEYETAFVIGEQSLEIASRHMEKDSADYISILMLVGTVASDTHRFELAEKYLGQSWEFRKNVLGENHPKTLTALLNLASLHNNQGNFDQGIPLNRIYVNKLIETFGDNSPKTGFGWRVLGLAYKGDQQHKLALSTFDEVIRIFKSQNMQDDYNYALAYLHKGHVLLKTEQLDNAEKAIQQSILLLDKVPNRHAEALSLLAELQLKSNHLELALEHATLALDIRLTQKSNPLLIAQSQSLLGAIYAVLEQPGAATEQFNLAIKILETDPSTQAGELLQRTWDRIKQYFPEYTNGT